MAQTPRARSHPFGRAQPPDDEAVVVEKPPSPLITQGPRSQGLRVRGCCPMHGCAATRAALRSGIDSTRRYARDRISSHHPGDTQNLAYFGGSGSSSWAPAQREFKLRSSARDRPRGLALA